MVRLQVNCRSLHGNSIVGGGGFVWIEDDRAILAETHIAGRSQGGKHERRPEIRIED